jgi:hypothetical protein
VVVPLRHAARATGRKPSGDYLRVSMGTRRKRELLLSAASALTSASARRGVGAGLGHTPDARLTAGPAPSGASHRAAGTLPSGAAPRRGLRPPEGGAAAAQGVPLQIRSDMLKRSRKVPGASLRSLRAVVRPASTRNGGSWRSRLCASWGGCPCHIGLAPISGGNGRPSWVQRRRRRSRSGVVAIRGRGNPRTLCGLSGVCTEPPSLGSGSGTCSCRVLRSRW